MEETNNKKQTTKTGKVLDFELLKRVLEFAKPYKFNFIMLYMKINIFLFNDYFFRNRITFNSIFFMIKF